MTALVSIIVPCFNYGDLLAETLHSVRAQTMQQWECLIVDDGSIDSTQSVVTEFIKADPRIRYIRQENQGPSSARNLGINNSAGEFIQFLDADDLIEPNKLEIQARFLKDNPSVDLVYGGAKYLTEPQLELDASLRKEMQFRWLPRVSAVDVELLVYLIRDNFLVISAPLFRRDLISRSGYFDKSLRTHEDWEFWIRCALNGARFHFLEADNTQTLIRVHGKSWSGNRLEMLKSNLKIRNQLASRLASKQIKAINYARALSMLLEATRVIAKSDIRSALQFGVNNWPRGHGFVPALNGISTFLLATLKTSRFGRNWPTTTKWS